jgi:hypothetical protein
MWSLFEGKMYNLKHTLFCYKAALSGKSLPTFWRTYNYLNPNFIEIRSEAHDRETLCALWVYYILFRRTHENWHGKFNVSDRRIVFERSILFRGGRKYLGSSVTVLLPVTGWTSTHGYWSRAGQHTVFRSVALSKCKSAHFQICMESHVSQISIFL